LSAEDRYDVLPLTALMGVNGRRPGYSARAFRTSTASNSAHLSPSRV